MTILLLTCVLTAAPAASPPHGEVRALAYNVMFDARAPEKSLDVIAAQDADLLCLTEVTPAFARRLEERVGTRYAHRVTRPAEGTWGVALWSKLPMVGEVVPQTPHKMPGVLATVHAGAETIHVGCVHAFPPGAARSNKPLLAVMKENAALREAQAKGWLARLPPGPALLLGDFNEGPDGGGVRRLLSAGFKRACAVSPVGCPPTFPGPASPWPAIVEIDHVLGRGIRFTDSAVIHGGGSDHFAVRANIALP